jgi:hypothetical protein
MTKLIAAAFAVALVSSVQAIRSRRHQPTIRSRRSGRLAGRGCTA